MSVSYPGPSSVQATHVCICTANMMSKQANNNNNSTFRTIFAVLVAILATTFSDTFASATDGQSNNARADANVKGYSLRWRNVRQLIDVNRDHSPSVANEAGAGSGLGDAKEEDSVAWNRILGEMCMPFTPDSAPSSPSSSSKSKGKGGSSKSKGKGGKGKGSTSKSGKEGKGGSSKSSKRGKGTFKSGKSGKGGKGAKGNSSKSGKSGKGSKGSTSKSGKLRRSLTQDFRVMSSFGHNLATLSCPHSIRSLISWSSRFVGVDIVLGAVYTHCHCLYLISLVQMMHDLIHINIPYCEQLLVVR